MPLPLAILAGYGIKLAVVAVVSAFAVSQTGCAELEPNELNEPRSDTDPTASGDVIEQPIGDVIEGDAQGDVQGDASQPDTNSEPVCKLTPSSDSFTIEGENHFVKGNSVFGFNGSTIYKCSSSSCSEIEHDACEGSSEIDGLNTSGNNLSVNSPDSFSFIKDNGDKISCNTIKNDSFGEGCVISMDQFTAGLQVGSDRFGAGSVEGCDAETDYAIIKIDSNGEKDILLDEIDSPVISMREAGSDIAILMENGLIALMDPSSLRYDIVLNASGVSKMVIDGNSVAVKSGNRILFSYANPIDLGQTFTDFDISDGVIYALTDNKKVLIYDTNEYEPSLKEYSVESNTNFNKISVQGSKIYLMTSSSAQTFGIECE